MNLVLCVEKNENYIELFIFREVRNPAAKSLFLLSGVVKRPLNQHGRHQIHQRNRDLQRTSMHRMSWLPNGHSQGSVSMGTLQQIAEQVIQHDQHDHMPFQYTSPSITGTNLWDNWGNWDNQQMLRSNDDQGSEVETEFQLLFDQRDLSGG